MSVRYRLPETTKLEISNGDWLLVKKRLTAGEYQRHLQLYLTTEHKVDGTLVGFSRVASYLLDWSFQSADGKPVAINGLDPKDIMTHLQDLPVEDFKEVLNAIDAHIEREDAAREAEKKGQGGENASSPISPSLATLGGDMNGSMNLTEMSTA